LADGDEAIGAVTTVPDVHAATTCADDMDAVYPLDDEYRASLTYMEPALLTLATSRRTNLTYRESHVQISHDAKLAFEESTYGVFPAEPIVIHPPAWAPLVTNACRASVKFPT
jgi:hypothetical protein